MAATISLLLSSRESSPMITSEGSRVWFKTDSSACLRRSGRLHAGMQTEIVGGLVPILFGSPREFVRVPFWLGLRGLRLPAGLAAGGLRKRLQATASDDILSSAKRPARTRTSNSPIHGGVPRMCKNFWLLWRASR